MTKIMKRRKKMCDFPNLNHLTHFHVRKSVRWMNEGSPGSKQSFEILL